LFELDWLIAGFVTPGKFAPGGAVPLVDSLVASRRKNGLVGSSALKTGTAGDMVWARLAVSPSGRLTNERLWDEPRLLDMIATAASTIDIQLLTYSDLLRDGEHWETLEKALKAAAKRGVTVRLLLSDWCKAKPTIDSVRDIAKTKGVEVKFMVIPEASTGFVPFSRVAHAKYMVIDGKKFWLGSANWEHNYFHTSRNVGMIVEGAATSGRLKSYFERNWTSPYAEALDLKKEYVARRVAE
jgi:phosphatidylserine/phosphatidylglycerophosphate/cardiolipin synthase-like enzyme